MTKACINGIPPDFLWNYCELPVNYLYIWGEETDVEGHRYSLFYKELGKIYVDCSINFYCIGGGG